MTRPPEVPDASLGPGWDLPAPEQTELDEFDRRLHHPRKSPLPGLFDRQRLPPWVIGRAYSDPADPAVFGAVVALDLGDDREPWLIRGVLRQSKDGTTTLSRLAVQHRWDPEREVTGRVMRAIPLGAIRDAALSHLKRRASAQMMLNEVGALSKSTADATRSAAGRGFLLDDAFYRHIAGRLLDLPSEGHSRDPLRALCAEESMRLGSEIKYERMKQWIRNATDRKYLEPGKPGVRLRRAGPRLIHEREAEDG